MRKVKKTKLNEAINNIKHSYQEAFQRLWDEINQGQQKKILKENPDIKEIFDLFGVEYKE